MTTVYAIEKWVGAGTPKASGACRYDWRLAYGLCARSFPKVSNDLEAVAVFDQEVTKTRSAAFRLVALRGSTGYNVATDVLATKRVPTQ